MGVRQRLGSAWRAFLKTGEDVVASATRPGDVGSLRYRQTEAEQLVGRYRKWVYVAVNRNSSAVASCRLMVMRKKRGGTALLSRRGITNIEAKHIRSWCGQVVQKAMSTQDELEEVTDDRYPLVSLLKNINPASNPFEWIFNTNAAMELTGNSFTTMFRSGGTPSELWHLDPQWVRPVINPNGTCEVYLFGRPAQERPIKPEEVMHFKVPNPFGNPWHGYGPLHAILTEADVSTKLSEFTSAMLDNGGHPGGILDLGPGASPDQMREAREEFESKYAGPHNAGRWIVLRGMKDHIKVHYPPQTEKNPVMSEAELKQRDVVAAAFDVPVGLMNMEEKSLANGQVVAPHWQMMAIRPRCARIENMLNEKLVPLFREALRDDSLFVCFENPVGEDQTALEESMVRLTGGKPIITVNEARAKLGLPPIEGGDDLVQPDAGEKEDPKGDGAGGKPDAEEDDTEAKSLSVDLWSGSGHIHQHKKLDDKEDALAAKIADILAGMFLNMVPQYAASVSGVAIGISAEVRSQFIASLIRLLDPYMKSAILGGYADNAPNLTPLEAVEFLADYTLRTANRAVQSFERRVTNIIADGVGSGRTIQQTAAAIREEMPKVIPSAATTIARSEYSRAYNVGKDRAWQVMGVARKEWLLSGNPCAVCEEIASKYAFADVGSPFVTKGTVVAGVVMDYADVYGGDAHPNCSCGTAAVLKSPIKEP